MRVQVLAVLVHCGLRRHYLPTERYDNFLLLMKISQVPQPVTERCTLFYHLGYWGWKISRTNILT